MSSKLDRVSGQLEWKVRETQREAERLRKMEARATSKAKGLLKRGKQDAALREVRNAVLLGDQAQMKEDNVDQMHISYANASRMAAGAEKLHTMAAVAQATQSAMQGFDVSTVGALAETMERANEDMIVATRLFEQVSGGSSTGEKVTVRAGNLLDQLMNPPAEDVVESREVQLLRQLMRDENGGASHPPAAAGAPSSGRGRESDRLRQQIAALQ